MGILSSLPGSGGGLSLLDELGPRQAGTTTTNTAGTQDLPAWLKPYAVGNLETAQRKRDSLYMPELESAAMPEFLKTINGDYLDANPYLDQMYEHGAKLIGANVDSRFESSGRYGSGAHAEALAEPLSGLYSKIFGDAYNAERGRQTAATLAAPTFGSGFETAEMYPYLAFNSLIPNLRDTTGSETSPYFRNPLGELAGIGAGIAAFSGGGTPRAR